MRVMSFVLCMNVCIAAAIQADAPIFAAYDKKKCAEGELKTALEKSAQPDTKKTMFDKQWLLRQARNIVLRVGSDFGWFGSGAMHRFATIRDLKIDLGEHEEHRDDAGRGEIALSSEIQTRRTTVRVKRRLDRFGIDLLDKGNEKLNGLASQLYNRVEEREKLRSVYNKVQDTVDNEERTLAAHIQREQTAYFQKEAWMSYLFYVTCEQIATDIVCTKTCEFVHDATGYDASMFGHTVYASTQSVIAHAMLKQRLISARELGSYAATDAVYGGGKKLIEHATGKKLSSLTLPVPEFLRNHDIDERIVIWALETCARTIIKSTFDTILNVEGQYTPLFSLGIPAE